MLIPVESYMANCRDFPQKRQFGLRLFQECWHVLSLEILLWQPKRRYSRQWKVKWKILRDKRQEIRNECEQKKWTDVFTDKRNNEGSYFTWGLCHRHKHSL